MARYKSERSDTVPISAVNSSNAVRLWRRRREALQWPPSLCSIAQNSFQGGVEIAPDLRHALIAVLAEERRWPVVLKNSLALLVLKQNHPQRRVEGGGKLMAGHL